MTVRCRASFGLVALVLGLPQGGVCSFEEFEDLEGGRQDEEVLDAGEVAVWIKPHGQLQPAPAYSSFFETRGDTCVGHLTQDCETLPEVSNQGRATIPSWAAVSMENCGQFTYYDADQDQIKQCSVSRVDEATRTCKYTTVNASVCKQPCDGLEYTKCPTELEVISPKQSVTTTICGQRFSSGDIPTQCMAASVELKKKTLADNARNSANWLLSGIARVPGLSNAKNLVNKAQNRWLCSYTGTGVACDFPECEGESIDHSCDLRRVFDGSRHGRCASYYMAEAGGGYRQCRVSGGGHIMDLNMTMGVKATGCIYRLSLTGGKCKAKTQAAPAINYTYDEPYVSRDYDEPSETETENETECAGDFVESCDREETNAFARRSQSFGTTLECPKYYTQVADDVYAQCLVSGGGNHMDFKMTEGGNIGGCIYMKPPAAIKSTRCKAKRHKCKGTLVYDFPEVENCPRAAKEPTKGGCPEHVHIGNDNDGYIQCPDLHQTRTEGGIGRLCEYKDANGTSGTGVKCLSGGSSVDDDYELLSEKCQKSNYQKETLMTRFLRVFRKDTALDRFRDAFQKNPVCRDAANEVQRQYPISGECKDCLVVKCEGEIKKTKEAHDKSIQQARTKLQKAETKLNATNDKEKQTHAEKEKNAALKELEGLGQGPPTRDGYDAYCMWLNSLFHCSCKLASAS